LFFFFSGTQFWGSRKGSPDDCTGCLPLFSVEIEPPPEKPEEGGRSAPSSPRWSNGLPAHNIPSFSGLELYMNSQRPLFLDWSFFSFQQDSPFSFDKSGMALLIPSLFSLCLFSGILIRKEHFLQMLFYCFLAIHLSLETSGPVNASCPTPCPVFPGHPFFFPPLSFFFFSALTRRDPGQGTYPPFVASFLPGFGPSTVSPLTTLFLSVFSFFCRSVGPFVFPPYFTVNP